MMSHESSTLNVFHLLKPLGDLIANSGPEEGSLHMSLRCPRNIGCSKQVLQEDCNVLSRKLRFWSRLVSSWLLADRWLFEQQPSTTFLSIDIWLWQLYFKMINKTFLRHHFLKNFVCWPQCQFLTQPDKNTWCCCLWTRTILIYIPKKEREMVQNEWKRCSSSWMMSTPMSEVARSCPSRNPVPDPWVLWITTSAFSDEN